MEYQEKSYRLFWISVLAFIIVLTVGQIALFEIMPDLPALYTIQFTMVIVNIFMVILCYIMYKTESIYWINGMSYEQAKSMTSEQRKKYAWSHLIVFGQGAIVSIIYCVVSLILDFSPILSEIILMLILIISAFRTITIK